MSDFSSPWDDGDGVKGLWRSDRSRDPIVYARIKARRLDHLRRAQEWKASAEADGWVFEPTYNSEPVDHAFRGTREGFTIQGLARPGKPDRLPSASIHIWGPDRLAIKAPIEYDMAKIRAGARTCGYCGAEDVDTIRVGFAGRCCHKCEPRVRPQVERPDRKSVV